MHRHRGRKKNKEKYNAHLPVRARLYFMIFGWLTIEKENRQRRNRQKSEQGGNRIRASEIFCKRVLVKKLRKHYPTGGKQNTKP